MMINSQKQLEITREQLQKFKDALKEIEDNTEFDPVQKQAYLDANKSQIEIMEKEISDYEKSVPHIWYIMDKNDYKEMFIELGYDKIINLPWSEENPKPSNRDLKSKSKHFFISFRLTNPGHLVEFANDNGYIVGFERWKHRPDWLGLNEKITLVKFAKEI